MYFPDLSPYPDAEPGVLCVGWLDESHDFPRGRVSPELLERLLRHCFRPVNQTRGYHQSPFARHGLQGLAVSIDGHKMRLGSAEVRVQQGGRVYAAPNLVYHYIRDVGYLPPQEFLDAIAATEPPSLPPRGWRTLFR